MLENDKAKNNKNIASEMVRNVIIMIIVSSVIVGIVSIYINRSNSINSYQTYANFIAEGVLAALDVDKMVETIEAKETNLYWYDIRKYLDDIKESSGAKFIYIAYFDGDDLLYFAEGSTSRDEYDQISTFAQKAEAGDFYEDQLQVVKKGRVSKSYNNYGDYGGMVSAILPISDNGGDVIGLVGVDMDANDVFTETMKFVITMLAIIIFVCILMGVIFKRNVNKFIGRPIGRITDAANKMVNGDIDIDLDDVFVKNEIGVLKDAFIMMNSEMKNQARILKRIAEGDFRERIKVRADSDVINKSINNLLDANLISVYATQNAAEQLAISASEIEAGAQAVAEGANEQASTIEQFKTAMDDLTSMTNSNAKNISEVDNSSRGASEKMQNALTVMDDLDNSLSEISDQVKEISNIMKLIDSISFQTNILSLNAAVEAARAGQHGAGFSVVADEVKQLANRSAAAAKETEVLLKDGIEAMENGSIMANQGNESLKDATNASTEIFESVKKIKEAAANQVRTFEAIMDRIEQLSVVVQKNSTISEESATAATQLTEMSKKLDEQMSRFLINEEDIKNLASKMKS